MATTLILIVIWSIVALVFYCCYRLWYWTPMPTTQVSDVVDIAVVDDSRAA